MNMIIINYQVIQDAKKCCNNTTIKKKLSKPKDRPGLQKEPNTPNESKVIEISKILE